MEREPKPEKGIEKDDLEKRLEEISKMKIDTQQEIDRLGEKLEQTERTLQALEAEEKSIKQQLMAVGELELENNPTKSEDKKELFSKLNPELNIEKQTIEVGPEKSEKSEEFLKEYFAEEFFKLLEIKLNEVQESKKSLPESLAAKIEKDDTNRIAIWSAFKELFKDPKIPKEISQRAESLIEDIFFKKMKGTVPLKKEEKYNMENFEDSEKFYLTAHINHFLNDLESIFPDKLIKRLREIFEKARE